MLQHQTDKAWVRQFDSLPDLSRWIDSTPRAWDVRDSRNRAATRDWDMGVGYDGALKLARDGWEEGIRNLHALSALVPNATRTTREYSVAGDFPDVPRYLAGDPYNMVKRGKQRVPKPAMTIAVSICASANVDARAFANYGAAMVALIDRLESRNVRVELLAMFATNIRGKVSMSWTVKRAQDPTDLSALAFSLGHPAMLRRLGFAVIERSPRAWECSDYGYPAGIHRSDFVDLPDNALLIDGIGQGYRCNTMADALKFAKEQINEAAGEDLVELEEWDA